MYKKIFCIMLMLIMASQSFAQQKDVSKMTREDILAMSYDELGAMPLEDVMKLTEILGVSLNELYEMLLNKDVTSASKKAESSFDSPLSTTVISYDEIIASGARNIQEAMRLVPGVIVREKTNGNYDIHIRGNNNIPDENLTVYTENSMTLVMIDNRPIYNYINGGTFWESFPIDIADVDRIEVVRGAASALYGANAVTGVINIITKNPESEDLHINGQLQGGNLGSYMGSLNVGQNIGKFGYRVSGNYQKMQRTTDKFYVFQYDSLFNRDDIQTLPDKTSYWLTVFNPMESIKDWHPYPETAVDRYGVNANLYFNAADDINFVLSGGYQDSYITSSSFGDPSISITGRGIKSTYANFIGKAKGLTLQSNIMFSEQDIVYKNVGFKADARTFNLNAEYDFYLGGLNIRPGFSYQSATYDDTPYLIADTTGRYSSGYMNGECSFNSIAGSLRLDYKMLDEKLRFILGGRFEKFDTSDDLYFPFQMVASYNLNDKHMFRIVGSMANRSPFIVDSYSNFDWNRQGRPFPSHMKFNGDKDQKLASTKNVEVGYRVRPVRNLFIEAEAFMSSTKNFGCLLPESVTAYVHTDSMSVTVSVPNLGPIYQTKSQPTAAIPYQVNLKYQNIDVDAHQYGITLNAEWVANEKLIFKAFGTYQITKLRDHNCYNNSQIVTDMTTLAAVNASQGKGIVGQGVDSYFSVPFTATATQQLENGGYKQIEVGLAQNMLIQQMMQAGLTKEEAAKQVEQMAVAGSAEWNAAAQQAAALMAQQQTTINAEMPSVIAEQYFNYEEYDQTLKRLQAAGVYPTLYNGKTYDGRYEKKEVEHKATPAFFGGFSANYTPIEKLNIYASGNFYSKQTYTTSNGTFEADPKFILNCKVSYKVWKDNAVFFNARNLLNDKKQEFAWTDETRGCYLVGLDLKF
ncbi:MAG: TonB-dependent receptor plug domain-containing protein [Salinivirgaceae bacterium]|nr:TonB-dependent receptor plug domain-containing protein [Salinivirgaceae bacterium]